MCYLLLQITIKVYLASSKPWLAHSAKVNPNQLEIANKMAQSSFWLFLSLKADSKFSLKQNKKFGVLQMMRYHLLKKCFHCSETHKSVGRWNMKIDLFIVQNIPNTLVVATVWFRSVNMKLLGESNIGVRQLSPWFSFVPSLKFLSESKIKVYQLFLSYKI